MYVSDVEIPAYLKQLLLMNPCQRQCKSVKRQNLLYVIILRIFSYRFFPPLILRNDDLKSLLLETDTSTSWVPFTFTRENLISQLSSILIHLLFFPLVFKIAGFSTSQSIDFSCSSREDTFIINIFRFQLSVNTFFSFSFCIVFSIGKRYRD